MITRIILLITISCSIIIHSHGQNFWEHISNCPGQLKTGLVVDPAGRIYVASMSSTTSGVNRSDDNGLTWQQKINGLSTNWVRAIDFMIDSTLFIGHNSGIYRTTNLGDNWELVYNPTVYKEYQVVKCGYDSIILVGGGPTELLVRSTDKGNNWSVVINYFSWDYWEYITDIYFAPNNVIYACSRFTENYSNKNPRVYYSTDFGKTWDVFWDPGTPSAFYALNMDNNGRLLVGGWSGIFRHDFNTGTWEHIALNATVKDILVVPNEMIYLACDPGGSGWGGVVASVNGGDTYSLILNSGLIFNEAVGFEKDNSGRILMRSWDYLYRSADTIFTNIDNTVVPDKPLLSCFPNPFHNSTKIKSTDYQIMKVNVYDLSGKMITSFEIPPMGEYLLEIGDVSKGILIAQFFTESTSGIIKIVHY